MPSSFMFAEPRDELAFLRYLGHTNSKVACWQRTVSAGGWILACTKVAAYAVQEQHIRYRFVLVGVFMAAMALCEFAAAVTSCCSTTWYGWYHEHIKVWLEVGRLMTVTVSIIMLRPEELAFNTPLAAMALRSIFLAIDQVRIHTALRLYALEAAVFAALELYYWSSLPHARTGKLPAGNPVAHSMAYLVAGIVLPLLVAATMEAQLRQSFLQQQQRPLSLLGPRWCALLAWCRQVERGGQLAASTLSSSAGRTALGGAAVAAALGMYMTQS